MASGPAWLGIGAARSGTTWFGRMLTRHSAVRYASNAEKEQLRLFRAIDGGLELDDYLRLFDGPAKIGEWTPQYLWLPWVVDVAAEVCRPDAPILCILRDPVERFRSEMRWYLSHDWLAGVEPRYRALIVAQTGTWGGMYATHLKPWRETFGRDRLVVMQYEAVVRDPQPHVERVWRMLGLDSEWSSVDPTFRTGTVSPVDWEWPDGLRERLVKQYRPQVERVVAAWRFDLDLWPNFARTH